MTIIITATNKRTEAVAMAAIIGIRLVALLESPNTIIITTITINKMFYLLSQHLLILQ